MGLKPPKSAVTGYELPCATGGAPEQAGGVLHYFVSVLLVNLSVARYLHLCFKPTWGEANTRVMSRKVNVQATGLRIR